MQSDSTLTTGRVPRTLREIVHRKVAVCPNMSVERIWEDLRAENPDRWVEWDYVRRLVKELR